VLAHTERAEGIACAQAVLDGAAPEVGEEEARGERVTGTDRVDLLIERVLAPLGRRVDRTSPIVDARLADGARVCAVLPPVAVDGPALSISLPLSSRIARTFPLN